MYSQANNPIQTAAAIRTFGQFEDAETLMSRLQESVTDDGHACDVTMDDETNAVTDPDKVIVEIKFYGLGIADLESELYDCVEALRKAILAKGGAK